MGDKLHTILEASVIAAAIATIPIVILTERDAAYPWLSLADWSIWAIFAVALAAETARADNRLHYLWRHPLDIAVVVLSFPMFPGLLALTRLARLSRLVRVVRLITVVARAIPALRATLGRRELIYATTLCGILVVTASVTLLLLEPNTVNGSFASALWWSMVTVTTVGYGDIAPATLPGRIAAVIVMVAGLGVISTLSASIAAYFVSQGRGSDMDRIEARLEHIEQLLDQDRQR